MAALKAFCNGSCTLKAASSAADHTTHRRSVCLQLRICKLGTCKSRMAKCESKRGRQLASMFVTCFCFWHGCNMMGRCCNAFLGFIFCFGSWACWTSCAASRSSKLESWPECLMQPFGSCIGYLESVPWQRDGIFHGS